MTWLPALARAEPAWAAREGARWSAAVMVGGVEGHQAPGSNLLLFAGLAPAVAAVGRDAQEEVGGHGCDGDHETHEGDEEVIIQGQGQVAGLEALLGQGEEWGALNFWGAPALSQLRICNTEAREGEAAEGRAGRASPRPSQEKLGFYEIASMCQKFHSSSLGPSTTLKASIFLKNSFNRSLLEYNCFTIVC